MKTALTILFAALFMLATPLLAASYERGEHRGRAGGQQNGWVNDRHDSPQVRTRQGRRTDQRGAVYTQVWANKGHQYDRHRHQRNDNWERRAKRHYKQHLRDKKHYYRSLKRASRPYYAQPALVVTAPRIVFRIDW